MKGALLAIVVCLAAGSSHALTKYSGEFGYDSNCSFGSEYCGAFVAVDVNDDEVLTQNELWGFRAFHRDFYHGPQKAYQTRTALSFHLDVSQPVPSGTIVAGFSGYTPDYDCLAWTPGPCSPTYRTWSDEYWGSSVFNLHAMSLTLPIPASAILLGSVMGGMLGLGRRRFLHRC